MFIKKYFLSLLLFLALLFAISEGFSQQKIGANADKVTTEVYAPIDIVFNLKQPPSGNPFDVTFGAIVTAPDSSTLHIPGFYNGNEEYILRFSPTQVGDWMFQTFASVPELSGRSGSVSVAQNANSNVHGAVQVHPELPQKFVYEDGEPYFALAFELDWLFALDYDNNSGIPKTEQIIREVKNNGFNQVVMNVYAYDIGWKVADNVPAQYDYGKPAFHPFLGSNEKLDFSSLNLDFFKHFDRVIQHLHEQGIVAHIMIYVWNKKVNWPPMYSAADNRYFDYIIKRYQAYPNIIWDVSKEALDYGRCDIPYINERIARIRSLDAYDRLITVHDYEYCYREPDRVDFISIQNWRPDLYSLSLEAYLRHSDKPVMNIEHGGYEEGPYLSFEGNYVNPEACLIRNYECVFAGVYSTYYWQNTSWNIVIYDPMNPAHDFAKPRFNYYKHLQTLFTRYDFHTLFPYKPKLTTNSRIGLDNMASSGYTLTNGKDLYLYLVPAANHQINVVLPEPPSGQLEAIWFNPFTGEFQDEGTSKWWNWKGYQSPWKNQYSVLILKSK